MDFYAVLDHVVALLQQRGRARYNALKLQFSLDDEQLAALKDELLYAHPQVVEDAGRGLRWTGDMPATRRQLRQYPNLHRSPAARQTSRVRVLPTFLPRLHLRPNAGNSPCCSVTWWTRPPSPGNSTRKTTATWCAPIKPPVPP